MHAPSVLSPFLQRVARQMQLDAAVLATHDRERHILPTTQPFPEAQSHAQVGLLLPMLLSYAHV